MALWRTTVSKSYLKHWGLQIGTLKSKCDKVNAWCAGEAVFCYTAENSHHLKAQVTSKNPQFQEEKISERRKARSQVTSEKSSKNYISLFGGKPAGGLPTPPPTSPRTVTAHFTRGEWQVRTASARSTRGIHSRGRGGGRGDLRNSAIC